jgi:hypothetical protein
MMYVGEGTIRESSDISYINAEIYMLWKCLGHRCKYTIGIYTLQVFEARRGGAAGRPFLLACIFFGQGKLNGYHLGSRQSNLQILTVSQYSTIQHNTQRNGQHIQH